MMKNVDMGLLKQLSALTNAKKDTGASKNRDWRTQRRGRRTSRQGGARQLSHGRQLSDVSAVLDTMWLLICGTFVFFMHAGFAMLEAGTGRAKNVQAILIKNLITVCAGTVGWYIMGWSLAYGGDALTSDGKGGFEER